MIRLPHSLVDHEKILMTLLLKSYYKTIRWAEMLISRF